MTVQITQGTQTSIYTKTNAGTEIQVVKLDIGSGTVVGEFVGIGTVNTVGLLAPAAFATTITTGTTTLGTVVAGVSGSVIYITDIVVSAGSATTLVIGNGGTNQPLLGTLSFAQYGGMVANFRSPIFGSSGSAVVYQQSVGCPLSISMNGYVK